MFSKLRLSIVHPNQAHAEYDNWIHQQAETSS